MSPPSALDGDALRSSTLGMLRDGLCEAAASRVSASSRSSSVSSAALGDARAPPRSTSPRACPGHSSAQSRRRSRPTQGRQTPTEPPRSAARPRQGGVGREGLAATVAASAGRRQLPTPSPPPMPCAFPGGSEDEGCCVRNVALSSLLQNESPWVRGSDDCASGGIDDNEAPPWSAVGTPVEHGVLFEPQELTRGLAAAVDVFKGMLVLSLASSLVIVSVSTAKLREENSFGLTLCNAGASLCASGGVATFGFACYCKLLRAWTGECPRLDMSQLMRIGALHIASIGVVCAAGRSMAKSPTADFLDGKGFPGMGPDILCASLIDLIIVLAAWRPLQWFVCRARPGVVRNFYVVLFALGVPLIFASIQSRSCGNFVWLRWLVPCVEESPGKGGHYLPAFPVLLYFGIGIMFGVCWDRFQSELRPTGPPGAATDLCLLPWSSVRSWASKVFFLLVMFSVLFAPLGQVWLAADFHSRQVDTVFGLSFVRAYPVGPTPLWLLATLWPTVVTMAVASMLVAVKGLGVLWGPLQQPIVEVEHLGQNALYYIAFLNVLLAVCGRDLEANPTSFSTPLALCGAGSALAIGRALHLIFVPPEPSHI
mmetsp:Transcript_36057/g.103708  ORF Transcript_36057/g.103708 Transcript_36057/m.103708 type:complete len:597 (-) Transcript_36057:99-1889(-)